MYVPLVENNTNEIFMAVIMDDESLAIKKSQFRMEELGINDPCFAIFRFRHYEAPISNTDEAIRLLNWYNAICETDSFDLPSPGERMIGQTFNVQCWKDLKFEDTEMAEFGHVYEAVIEEYYGFGTDGFVIPELNMTIDTALLAINHFIIA